MLRKESRCGAIELRGGRERERERKRGDWKGLMYGWTERWRRIEGEKELLTGALDRLGEG